MHCRKFQKDMQDLLKFQAYKCNILMNIHEHIHHQILKSNQILVHVVVVVGVVDMKVVDRMLEVVGMMGHMLEVVVVVVVVEVVVFRHMQQSNVCNHIIVLQHHRKGLWGNGFGWY